MDNSHECFFFYPALIPQFKIRYPM
jgi:hypothetical protein